jgi:protein-tyrosine-phosphatase
MPLPRKAILIVCEGNTCRSAMAEVIARSIWSNLQADVSSAGTIATEGEPMDKRAFKALQKHNYQCSVSHRARKVKNLNLSDYHCIISLDNKTVKPTLLCLLRKLAIPESRIICLHLEDPMKPPAEQQDYDKCAKELEQKLLENYPEVVAIHKDD